MKAQEAIDLVRLIGAATGVLIEAYPAVVAIIDHLGSHEDASLDELRAIVADEQAAAKRIADEIAARSDES